MQQRAISRADAASIVDINSSSCWISFARERQRDTKKSLPILWHRLL